MSKFCKIDPPLLFFSPLCFYKLLLYMYSYMDKYVCGCI